jgi:molecular chaperone GrpE (heat shock protein)
MSEPAITEPSATPEGTEPAAQQTPTDWEAEAKKWEKRSKDNFAKLKEAEPKLAEYEQIVASRKTEAERQAEELSRWQADAEKWRGAAVKSRIETLAGDFADPTDALAAIGDPAQFLDAGGQINDEAIKAELASVLERKPHWRRQDAPPPSPRPPAPNRAQGAGGTATADPAAALSAILQGQLRS